ncbi:MAG: Rrf2 family transcriptional regulator [Thermodesulfobacteriota bacterium]|nr:Rrf2 family transcriptional regulator [Thermodesulfobacteriota bacterium]
MKISTRARYGTRAMLELAANYDKGPILLKDIAKRQDISFRYLDQLIIPLKTAGFIRNIRGKGGGYVLTKPPSHIKLSEVLQVLEGSMAPVDCIDDPQSCNRTESCTTRDVWIQVKDAMFDVLDSLTLGDMVRRQADKERHFSTDYQI